MPNFRKQEIKREIGDVTVPQIKVLRHNLFLSRFRRTARREQTTKDQNILEKPRMPL